jgi:hypothetical protein
MKKMKHKLAIITTAALIRVCDTIIASNLAAGNFIEKVSKTGSRKKRYIKVGRRTGSNF